MTEKTATRVGIVASIVGAVGAIVYLIRKPQAAVSTAAAGPYIGLTGATVPGLSMAADSHAGEGGAGAPPALPADVTPTGAEINQYFTSAFTPAGAASPYPSTVIASNAPPLWSWPRYSTEAAGAGGNGGSIAPKNASCGCSGGRGCDGNGCRGSKCPNTPGPLIYRDGAGACAATTEGRLLNSWERCKPDGLNDSMQNMIGWSQSYSSDSGPDWNAFVGAVQGAWDALPGVIPTAKWEQTNNVPASRFGAS